MRAVFEAACSLRLRGIDVRPELMVPLVSDRRELAHQRMLVDATARAVFADLGVAPIEYSVGTMIEVPRAAIVAAEVAESADFFSFGTNDLTQACFGMSRQGRGEGRNETENEEQQRRDF